MKSADNLFDKHRNQGYAMHHLWLFEVVPNLFDQPISVEMSLLVQLTRFAVSAFQITCPLQPEKEIVQV